MLRSLFATALLATLTCFSTMALAQEQCQPVMDSSEFSDYLRDLGLLDADGQNVARSAAGRHEVEGIIEAYLTDGGCINDDAIYWADVAYEIDDEAPTNQCPPSAPPVTAGPGTVISNNQCLPRLGQDVEVGANGLIQMNAGARQRERQAGAASVQQRNCASGTVFDQATNACLPDMFDILFKMAHRDLVYGQDNRYAAPQGAWTVAKRKSLLYVWHLTNSPSHGGSGVSRTRALQEAIGQVVPVNTNLSVDLSGLTLHRSVFGGVQIRGANFSGSHLQHSGFGRSNLAGSNFRSANCQDCYFTGANIEGVDFTNANLTNATFGMDSNEHGSRPVRANAATRWSNTTCPDGTNSDNNGGTCCGHWRSPTDAVSTCR